MKKRLYFVKREVLATSISAAIHMKGTIYEIQMASEQSQPEESTKVEGFIKRKTK